MIKNYVIYMMLLFSFFGFSQSEILLKGKLVSENSPIANAEIINTTSKKVVVSDEFGLFTIPVKRADLLVIVAKNCFEKQIYLSNAILSQTQISIEVTKKANELNEVVVTKEQFVTPAEIEIAKSMNNYNRIMTSNQTGVYTGETVNAMDFVAIGKLIGKLFKKKKKKPLTNTNFKEYIAENVDESFLHKTLKLRDEDYFRFLDFCEADPKVSDLVKDENQFNIINFLFDKKAAFDKL